MGEQVIRKAVLIHDAIMYMTREEDLSRAIRTAFDHLRPGGAALFAPDHVRETFRPSSDNGGHDGADGRGLSYLEWIWDPDLEDTTCVVDYAYLLREADGSVRCEHDRHIVGLFSRDTWLHLLSEPGFRAVQVIPLVHSEVEPGSVECFVGRR